MKDKTYLIFVHGCVEPELHGPLKEDKLVEKAKELLEEHGEDENAVFELRISESGEPTVYPFSGAELSDDVEQD